MEIGNKDEGVLDMRVLATHEAQFGQPAGTILKVQVVKPKV